MPEDPKTPLFLPRPSEDSQQPLYLPRLSKDEPPATPIADPATRGASLPLKTPRTRRAVESILENEALTDNLDDDGASVLLQWGMTLAQRIAAETAGLDDETAEKTMYPQMRALRKMLRRINRWAAAPDSRKLEKIIGQAGIIYGAGYEPPGTEECELFSRQFDTGVRNSAQAIGQLRQLIEQSTDE